MSEEYQDIEIICSDCQEGFTFTAREQKFFASKVDSDSGRPFQHPKRCKPCRDKRKFRDAPNRITE